MPMRKHLSPRHGGGETHKQNSQSNEGDDVSSGHETSPSAGGTVTVSGQASLELDQNGPRLNQ
jgi:hypothetical protein